METEQTGQRDEQNSPIWSQLTGLFTFGAGSPIISNEWGFPPSIPFPLKDLSSFFVNKCQDGVRRPPKQTSNVFPADPAEVPE